MKDGQTHESCTDSWRHSQRNLRDRKRETQTSKQRHQVERSLQALQTRWRADAFRL